MTAAVTASLLSTMTVSGVVAYADVAQELKLVISPRHNINETINFFITNQIFKLV